MTELSNAEKHAAIVNKIYPDVDVTMHCDECYIQETPSKYTLLDLLETDKNGNPTQQAKASAFDVFINLNNQAMYQKTAIEGKILMGGMLGEMTGDNPCEAIFNAAWEIVKP